MNDGVKYTLDGASLTLVATTLAGWLPQIAAAFSIVWTLLRICEMARRWRRERRRGLR